MPVRLCPSVLALVLLCPSVLALVLLCAPLHSAAQSFSLQSSSLYAQAVRRALLDTAPASSRRLEILLLDLRTREILVDSFRNSAAPIPAGSLLKPFLALAWLEAHPHPPPLTVFCHGHADRCWRAAGHGSLALQQALAQSCNAYFLALAAQLDPARIPYLPPAPVASTPATLIGLTPQWSIAPRSLLLAYAALLAAPPDSSSAMVRWGMALAASSGTAAHLGGHAGGVLAKTGTAPCIDPHCAASGDGLVVVAVPALKPELLLLVRHRATTGSATAADAGQLLSRLEALHAY